MGLRLRKVRLESFRSYDRFELDDIGALTVLDGENAAGKTNALEGVQLLTALSSFRHPTARQLVAWGHDSARLSARIEGDDGRLLEVDAVLKEGSRTYRLNGKPRRAAELRGMLPAVCFTPDDLELAKGSNGVKRTALDDMGSQMSRNYHAVRRDYEKMLRQKNRLLKDGAPAAFRASVDDVLVAVGAHLTAKRADVLARLRPYVQDYYRTLSGGVERVDVSYVPSWVSWDAERPWEGAFALEEARSELARAVEAGSQRELDRGRALWGPHADAIAFFVDGRNAAQFASQGQQRSLVLAFKLAEVALVREMTGQQPVLLLDDVMSELDARRRDALVEFIEGDIQTFITTTNLGYFSKSLLDRARIVRLRKDEGVTRVETDVDLPRETPEGQAGRRTGDGVHMADAEGDERP